MFARNAQPRKLRKYRHEPRRQDVNPCHRRRIRHGDPDRIVRRFDARHLDRRGVDLLQAAERSHCVAQTLLAFRDAYGDLVRDLLECQLVVARFKPGDGDKPVFDAQRSEAVGLVAPAQFEQGQLGPYGRGRIANVRQIQGFARRALDDRGIGRGIGGKLPCARCPIRRGHLEPVDILESAQPGAPGIVCLERDTRRIPEIAMFQLEVERPAVLHFAGLPEKFQEVFAGGLGQEDAFGVVRRIDLVDVHGLAGGEVDPLGVRHGLDLGGQGEA